MTGALPGRPRFLAFLPDFLFATDANRPRYIAKTWMLVLLPSLALSLLVQLLLPQAEVPDIRVDGAIMVFLLVVVSPVLETLLMTPPLLVANRYLGPGPAVVGSAVMWGAIHSLSAPAWGLVTWWPFLILSIALLTWRERGLVLAMLIVMIVHALQNSVSAVLLLIMGLPN